MKDFILNLHDKLVVIGFYVGMIMLFIAIVIGIVCVILYLKDR